MAVQESTDAPEGVEKHKVPAATYAVFGCSLQEIGRTYGYIWDNWLRSSAYAQDTTKLGFDYFAPGTSGGESSIEIWFPVKEEEDRAT